MEDQPIITNTVQALPTNNIYKTNPPTTITEVTALHVILITKTGEEMPMTLNRISNFMVSMATQQGFVETTTSLKFVTNL